MQKLNLASFGLSTFFVLAAAPTVALAQTTVDGGNLINQTWTQANSPYIVKGDLTVPSGSTFTIEAGVEVRFDTGDQQGAGKDTQRSEITVEGVFVVNGSTGEPVRFLSHGAAAKSTWYGIVLEPNASATIQHASIKDANIGVTSNDADTFRLERSEVANMSGPGVHLEWGNAVLDGVHLHHCENGVQADSETSATLNNLLAHDHDSAGVWATTARDTNISLTIHSSTFYNNGYAGVRLKCGYNSQGAIDIYNSLSVNNTEYGFQSVYSPDICRLNASYSNAWGNGSEDLYRVSAGDGMLSANPQFVDAPNGDFHLKASSVAIDAGTATDAPAHDLDGAARPVNGDGINAAEYDMGAYEFGGSVSTCGDGVTEGNEACDDGADNGTYGYCLADCTAPGPACGDGEVNGPEECDDGNTDDGDGCDSICMIEPSGGDDVGPDAGPGDDVGPDAGPGDDVGPGQDTGLDAVPGDDVEDQETDEEDTGYFYDDIGNDQLDDAGQGDDTQEEGPTGETSADEDGGGCGCAATSATPTPGGLAGFLVLIGSVGLLRRRTSKGSTSSRI